MSSDAQQFPSKSDPILANIIAQIPEPIIESTNDAFHDLMSCVLEQQIHYRSTKKTFQKMLQLADIERLTLANFEIFEEKFFTTAKLSINKYETVLGVLTFLSDKILIGKT